MFLPYQTDPAEIKKIHLERIVPEIDYPYLVSPQVEAKRNGPLNVRYVAEKIARIKKTSFEEIAKITTQTPESYSKFKKNKETNDRQVVSLFVDISWGLMKIKCPLTGC